MKIYGLKPDPMGEILSISGLCAIGAQNGSDHYLIAFGGPLSLMTKLN